MRIPSRYKNVWHICRSGVLNIVLWSLVLLSSAMHFKCFICHIYLPYSLVSLSTNCVFWDAMQSSGYWMSIENESLEESNPFPIEWIFIVIEGRPQIKNVFEDLISDMTLAVVRLLSPSYSELRESRDSNSYPQKNEWIYEKGTEWKSALIFSLWGR